jgi:hypothetical protein
MAVIRGQSYIVDFVEWDLANNAPKTGDAANITVRISKDGGALTAATNNPVEVDATNAPGLYRITLTASEMDANTIEVVPKSTTANTYCQVVTILTERGRVDTTLSSRATAADVWGYSSRTLTGFGTLVSDIWSHSSRTLTSFGTLVNDVASAVWSYTIEASQSALAWMRLVGSVLFGKLTRSGTSYAFRDWNDSKNRIVGSVDNDGNRSITSRDGS